MKNKKILKRLKIITLICILFLVAEVFYVVYSLSSKSDEFLYFDGLNAVTNNDKYYVTVGSNNNNEKRFEKAKITLFNMKKNRVFEKVYNKGFNSAYFDVAIDDDSIIAVGSFEKDDVDHEDSVRKALITKYDFDGNIIFESDFSLLDNSKFTSVTVVDDGYLVTGQSIYKTTKVGVKSGGAILAKYDKDGVLVWSQNYGNSKSAVFNDLIVINDYIYVVGVDADYLGLLCKYDLNGNFVSYNDYKWTDSLGFSGISKVDDRIFVTGANRTRADWTNAMIVEYNTDCEYINQVTFEGTGASRFDKIKTDINGNLIAIGTVSLKNKSNDLNIYNHDAIIGKYDYNLKEISVVTYGDDKDDYFTDLTIINNNYLLIGYSSYEDGGYYSKFIRYSDALKLLGVE